MTWAILSAFMHGEDFVRWDCDFCGSVIHLWGNKFTELEMSISFDMTGFIKDLFVDVVSKYSQNTTTTRKKDILRRIDTLGNFFAHFAQG